MLLQIPVYKGKASISGLLKFWIRLRIFDLCITPGSESNCLPPKATFVPEFMQFDSDPFTESDPGSGFGKNDLTVYTLYIQ